MLNLNSTIDLNFNHFFRWWKQELDFLIPEKIKHIINENQGVIVILHKDNKLILFYCLGDVEEHLVTLDRMDKTFNIQSLLEKDERLAKAKILIRLSGSDVIQKELSLPVAAKENLEQVVSYELDRYTPFKPEDVYFAIKTMDGVNEVGQIRVKMILTTREILDGLYDDVKTIGLIPLYVDCEESPNSLDYLEDGYTLLPDILQQKKANIPRLIHGLLMTLTGILLLLVLVIPVLLEYQSVNELQLKAMSLEKDAKKVKTMQSSIDAVIDETTRLIKEKSVTPDLVDMLNTLSILLKDDTSLSYVQYSDGHLQIQGESPAASGLLAVLETSDMFVNARFASPVTQDRSSKLERFQITVDVAKIGGKVNE